MAIFKVTKDGVSKTITQESSQYTYKPDGKTKFYDVQRIVYYHNHRIAPIFVNLNDKRYLMPSWTEVHSSTEFNDVIWNKPDVKEEIKEVKTFYSSSNPNIKYKTTKITSLKGEVRFGCNCPGRWRAKNGECKHIKEMKSY